MAYSFYADVISFCSKLHLQQDCIIQVTIIRINLS